VKIVFNRKLLESHFNCVSTKCGKITSSKNVAGPRNLEKGALFKAIA
jgi:hypothetical protein